MADVENDHSGIESNIGNGLNTNMNNDNVDDVINDNDSMNNASVIDNTNEVGMNDEDNDAYSLHSQGTLHSSYASQSECNYIGTTYPIVSSLAKASVDALPTMCASRSVVSSVDDVQIVLGINGSGPSSPSNVPLFPVFHGSSAHTAAKRKNENDSEQPVSKKSNNYSSHRDYDIVPDSAINVTTITGSAAKDVLFNEVTATIEYTATTADVAAIQNMLENGYGTYGHPNSKLELLPSRLGPTAGRGVFVRAGCEIQNGDCISEYTGENTTMFKSSKKSIEKQLYNINVGSVCIDGDMQPVEGRGYASFINSAVSNGYLGVVRLVDYNNRIFFMCNVDPRYPLRGGFEIYLTAGKRWWKKYNEFLKK